MQTVSVGIWAGAGGRHEAAGEEGVAHFLEHILFKGTPTRSARQISEAVEGVGGDLNAMTSEEFTCYYARACHGHWPRLLDVLSDMFKNAHLPPEEIERERGVILEEIRMGLDQPSQHVSEMLSACLWPEHPLGRPLLGTPESVASIDKKLLAGFRGRHYLPSDTVICASGKIEHETFVQAVKETFAKWRPRTTKAPRRTPQKLRPCAQFFQRKETEQAHLALGWRACSRHDERRYALRLLNVILGENMSSRLFQEIREKRGLAYAVNSSTSHFADTGMIGIYAGLDARQVAPAIRCITKELGKLKSRPVSRDELRRAQDYAAGLVWMGMESVSGQMLWAGESILGYEKIWTPEELVQKTEAVTAAQIQSAAQDFFRADLFSVSLIAPDFSTEKIHAAMEGMD